MANGKNGHRMILTEAEWKQLPEESRSWITFQTIHGLDQRVEVLEGKKRFDRLCAFMGGVIGGVAAALGIKLT